MATVLLAATACPLELVSASVGRDVINQPTVRLVVRNVAAQAVVAFEVSVFCYDRFDDPVKHAISGTNEFRGISQKTIREGATAGKSSAWTLHFRGTTSKVRVVLNRVKLQNGTTWKPANGQPVSISGASGR